MGVEILLDEPAVQGGRQRVHRPRGPRGARRGRDQAPRRRVVRGDPGRGPRRDQQGQARAFPSTATRTQTRSRCARSRRERSSSPPATSARTPAGDRPPKFLWNAKMRFGKTFATYQLAKGDGLDARPGPHLQAGGANRLARRPAQPRRFRRLALRRPRYADRRAEELLAGTDPCRPLRLLPGSERKSQGRPGQGPQRVDPRDPSGTASSSTSTTSAPGAIRRASSMTRPIRRWPRRSSPRSG